MMDMLLKRQAAFWLAALVVFVAVLWLLHDILLPFVAGMVLAYLFDPLVNRLERLGLGRFVAAFVIIGIFLLVLIVLTILLAPILIGQLGGLADNLPGYVSRLQSLVTDPSRPWLTKIVWAAASRTPRSAIWSSRRPAAWSSCCDRYGRAARPCFRCSRWSSSPRWWRST